MYVLKLWFSEMDILLNKTLHVDYANEESIGLAIRESGFQRDELFVTTKYDGGDIQKAIRESLTKVCMYCPLFVYPP